VIGSPTQVRTCSTPSRRQGFQHHTRTTIVPWSATITEAHALGAAATQSMFLVEPFYWNLDDLSRQWSKRLLREVRQDAELRAGGAYSADTKTI